MTGQVPFLLGSLGEWLAGLWMGGSRVLAVGELRWASSMVECDKRGMGSRLLVRNMTSLASCPTWSERSGYLPDSKVLGDIQQTWCQGHLLNFPVLLNLRSRESPSGVAVDITSYFNCGFSFRIGWCFFCLL